MAVKTAKVYVRVTSVLRGRLIQEAGDMSSVSTVIRTILERHYAAKMKR